MKAPVLPGLVLTLAAYVLLPAATAYARIDLRNYLAQWTCNDGSLPQVNDNTRRVYFACGTPQPQRGSWRAYWRKHNLTDNDVIDSTLFDNGTRFGIRFRKTESMKRVGSPGAGRWGYCPVACTGLGDGGDVAAAFYYPSGAAFWSYTLTQAGGQPVEWFIGPYCRPQQEGWFISDQSPGKALAPVALSRILSSHNGPFDCPSPFPANSLAYAKDALVSQAWPRFRVSGTDHEPVISTLISEHYAAAPGASPNQMERFFYGYRLGQLRWESWCTLDNQNCPRPDPNAAAECPPVAHSGPPDDGNRWAEVYCHQWTDFEPESGRTQTMPADWTVDAWGWPPPGD
jgi:hypothetical protein